MLVGLGVRLLPEVPSFEVDPEWIIAGVLPPLLYSAAVSMPTMEFRRDFTAISGLSIVLVLITSVLLGLLFTWLIPDLGLALGIALGAIVSPTDAVATSIVKRLGVSPRVRRCSTARACSTTRARSCCCVRRSRAPRHPSRSGVSSARSSTRLRSPASSASIVGWVNLRIRARVANPTVNTVISFTMPFIASIPAEHLGASGLVAAVVAGLVTGRGAARYLTPQHRLSDVQNWRTVELVLEGAVFLVMGLELTAIVDEVESAHEGVWAAIRIAAIAFAAAAAHSRGLCRAPARRARSARTARRRVQADAG